jgi:hypothetical protein
MYAVLFAILLVIVLLYARRCTETYNSGEDVLNGEPKIEGAFVYYPGTYGFSVKAGGAPTPKTCYEWAKRNGVNHWGWRRNDKSCFNYADPSILTLMRYRDDTHNQTNVKIGCTEPGVKVMNGCLDWSKGNMVWGKLDDSKLKKFIPAVTSTYLRTTSLEECRAAAAEEEYDAFVYTTNRHDLYPATCYGVYNNSLDLYDFLGGKVGSDMIDDYRYITACTDPEKSVRTGCK